MLGGEARGWTTACYRLDSDLLMDVVPHIFAARLLLTHISCSLDGPVSLARSKRSGRPWRGLLPLGHPFPTAPRLRQIAMG